MRYVIVIGYNIYQQELYLSDSEEVQINYSVYNNGDVPRVRVNDGNVYQCIGYLLKKISGV